MEPIVIKPEPGRHVHLFFAEGKYEFGHAFHAGRPHAAIITAVHGDRMVNVAAFDANGKQAAFCSVALRQPGDGTPIGSVWAEWMPYTVESAVKKQA